MSAEELAETTVYGTVAKPKKLTRAPKTIDSTLTINQFMDDVKLRFADMFKKNTVQLMVYFFTDKSIYSKSIEKEYISRTVKSDYIVLRPEMITFVMVDADKKVKRQPYVSKIDVYKQYGIIFQTHMPFKKTESFRSDREVKTDKQVNCLVINTTPKDFDRQGKFDPVPQKIKYYEWTVAGVPDARQDSTYLMKNQYDKVDQFEDLSESLKSQAEGEDLDFDDPQ